MVLFISAPHIASFYKQPLLTSITRVYSLNLVINSLAAVNKTILVIRVDFKTQSKISLISTFISGVLGIICAYQGYGVWALVVQVLASAVFNVFFSFLFVRWIPKFSSFSFFSFRKLFAYGSKLLVASIISSVYDNVYSLVIGKRFSPATLGYYTRSYQFADLAGTNISGIITRVCFPVLSKIQDDDERLLSAYKKYIKMTALIMFPVLCLLSGIAEPLILCVLGAQWTPSIPLLHILPFAFLFNGISVLNLNLLYVKGRSDLVLRLEVIKKMIAFSILFVSLFGGVEFMCLGLVLYSFIGFFLNTIYTNRLLNYGFIKQVIDFFPYLAASLVVLVEGLILSGFINQPILSLVLSFVACSASFLFICSFGHFSAFEELVGIVMPYFRKIKNT